MTAGPRARIAESGPNSGLSSPWSNRNDQGMSQAGFAYPSSSYFLRWPREAFRALIIRILLPRSACTMNKTRPRTDIPIVTSLPRSERSGAVTARESSNAVIASSKETACRWMFWRALPSSHSNAPKRTLAIVAKASGILRLWHDDCAYAMILDRAWPDNERVHDALTWA